MAEIRTMLPSGYSRRLSGKSRIGHLFARWLRWSHWQERLAGLVMVGLGARLLLAGDIKAR